MGEFSESSNVIWTIRKYVRRLRRMALDELAEDYELFREDFVRVSSVMLRSSFRAEGSLLPSSMAPTTTPMPALINSWRGGPMEDAVPPSMPINMAYLHLSNINGRQVMFHVLFPDMIIVNLIVSFGNVSSKLTDQITSVDSGSEANALGSIDTSLIVRAGCLLRLR